MEKMGDGADESEEGGDEGDEKTEENTGGLDGKDTGMMFRARVVIPTAADQHQATPA